MKLRWDDFAIDVAARRLVGPDGDIHVEPQVFDVLALLIDERDRVVPKDEILDRVWGDQFVSESALTTRIKQARQSLGDDGRTQRYIRNVHGRGYQFVGRPLDGPGDQRPDAAGPGAPNGRTGLDRAAALAREIAVDADFPFVGRKDELAGAAALLAEPAGGAVLIGGPPGVGKSRLAVELLERAGAAGAMVAAGRCEPGVTSGLQPIRDAFASVAAADPADVARWAAGVEGPLLGLIPSLADHLANDPIAVDAYAGIDAFVVATDRLAARAPVVMLVDDLHWSDEPTRTFLDRLDRRLADRPIAIIVTHRVARADLPDEVRQWIDRRSRTERALTIDLEGLTTDAAGGLIRSVLEDASDADVDELVGLTGANCLFLTETLRDLPKGGETARSVAELIAARVGRQDEAVQRVVTAGAALGAEFPFEVAASAAGLDRRAALAAIDRALAAELLHETSAMTRFRFSHQLVPESIIDELGRAERAELHLRCAEGLAAAGAAEAEIVLHRLQAVPLVPQDEAVAQAREAARLAREANQFDLALRLLQRANDADPEARTRAEILLETAHVLNDMGTPGRAVDDLDRLAGSARRNGWPDLVVAAALARWSLSPFRRPNDRTTIELLEEAEALVDPEDTTTRALVLAKTASFSIFTDRLPERMALADRAVEMARAGGAPAEDLLTVLEGAAIAATCPAGTPWLEILDPEIDRLRRATGRTYFHDASAPETLAMMLGRGEAFRRAADPDPDRVAAQPIAEWRELTLQASLAAFTGRYDEARDGYDRAAEIGEAFWGESSFPLHAFAHLFLDLVTDDWSRSCELLEALWAFGPEAVFAPPLALALHHQGGRDDEVAGLVAGIEARNLRSYSEHIVGGNSLIACAELALALDDDRLADLVEEHLQPLARLMLGLPWSPALAAGELLARLVERRGDADAARAHRRTAADLYEGLGATSLRDRLDRPAG